MNKNLEQFAEKLKQIKTVYLAGGIQNASMPNSWRSLLTEFFAKNNVKSFNPVSDNTAIFNQSVLGYKEDGTKIKIDDLQDTDEIKEALLFRQTELNDKNLIKKADLMFFYYDDRIGHGTRTEFDWACDMKKKTIMVRTIPRNKIAHWNKWRRLYGLLIDRNVIEFKSLSEAKQFFIDYLKFKEI